MTNDEIKLLSKMKINDIQTSNIIDSLAYSLGLISIIILPYCIFKYKNPEPLKKMIFTKTNMKYQGILWLNIILSIIFIGASSSVEAEDINDFNDPHVNILCTREAFGMAVLTILTIILLKEKYYLHHIISIVIFCLLSISIDFLLGNFTIGLIHQGIIKIIFDILSFILELFGYCYQTYMMNKLFYNYWSVGFSQGFLLFIINTILLLGSLILGNPYGERNLFNNLYYYFREVNIGFIILRFLLKFIFFGLIMNIIKMSILNTLNANHLLIGYEISKISNILMKTTSGYKWYSLILFLFQFLCLMFFLEILEYNFCGLNNNTKRNIQLREDLDMANRDSLSSNNIELNGYIFNNDNDDINEENSNNKNKQNKEKE